ITNPSSVAAVDVEIEAIVPNHLANFARDLTSASSCTGGSTCRSGDRIIWKLGGLAPGQGAAVDVPAVVRAGDSAPPPGSEIAFSAVARAGGRQLATAAAQIQVDQRQFDLALRENAD